MYKTYLFLQGTIGSEPFLYRSAQAASAIATAVPGAVGYTQTRTLTEQIGGREAAPFTGIAELCFDDLAAALESGDHATAMSGLLTPGTQVGPVVTGTARTVLRLAAHHHGGLIKGVFPFRRKAGLAVADFQRYWWLQHGPVAALTENAVYYLQCHPLAQTYANAQTDEDGSPPYDGITELHWPDAASARAAMSSRQMIEDQGADARNFVAPGSVLLFLAVEEVVVAA